MPVDFVLEKFNYELEMGVSGELYTAVAPVLDVSATAEYYVSVADMRDTFYFQTDSRDINDLSGEDVKYYVKWPAHVVLNPCHAFVSGNPIAVTNVNGVIDDNRQLVKHDFIRHVAKDLFNTHLGVDLFSNEQELKDDLASKGHIQAWSSILTDISAVNVLNSSLLGPDAYGEYYTSDALDTSANLCRELLGQLLKTAPSRVYDLSAIAVDGNLALEKFFIPFEDGDSISFKLTLSAAPNQHELVSKATAVPDRSYKVRVNVVNTVNADSSTHASGTNVVVNDCTDTTLHNSRVKVAPA
jgi:hypothetical protein